VSRWCRSVGRCAGLLRLVGRSQEGGGHLSSLDLRFLKSPLSSQTEGWRCGGLGTRAETEDARGEEMGCAVWYTRYGTVRRGFGLLLFGCFDGNRFLDRSAICVRTRRGAGDRFPFLEDDQWLCAVVNTGVRPRLGRRLPSK
jgi:hypothetical protein